MTYIYIGTQCLYKEHDITVITIKGGYVTSQEGGGRGNQTLFGFLEVSVLDLSIATLLTNGSYILGAHFLNYCTKYQLYDCDNCSNCDILSVTSSVICLLKAKGSTPLKKDLD
jgi:hypothetical protein